MKKGSRWTKKQRAQLSRAQRRAWKHRRTSRSPVRAARHSNGHVEFWQGYIERKRQNIRHDTKCIRYARSILRHVQALA